MGSILRPLTSPSPSPAISVVIPSRDGNRGGNVQRLLESLARQTLPPDEIVLAVGYSPCGRAHNAGARAARGEVLVFLDDDVTLGSEHLLERMVRALRTVPGAGLVGASQLPPGDSPAFALALVRGSARAQLPIQSAFVETDMATHAALAVRRDTYWQAGGEPHDTLRADDQVLRARVRALGLRVGVAGDAWVFHPQPAGWRPYLTARYRDGQAAAHDARLRPDLLFDTPDAASYVTPGLTPLEARILRWALRLVGQALSFTPVPIGQLAYAAGYLQARIRPQDLPDPAPEERCA